MNNDDDYPTGAVSNLRLTFNGSSVKRQPPYQAVQVRKPFRSAAGPTRATPSLNNSRPRSAKKQNDTRE